MSRSPIARSTPLRAAAALLALLAACGPQSAAPAAEPGVEAGYPSLSALCEFFDARRTSASADERLRLIQDVIRFGSHANPEVARFVAEALQDEDSSVCNAALKVLYDDWAAPAPEDLPAGATVLVDGEEVSLTSEGVAAHMIELCRSRGIESAGAAYVLGLLRAPEAVPAIRTMTDAQNVYVRYTAARALLDCGDEAGARAAFDEISSSILAQYEEREARYYELPVDEHDYREYFESYYAALACRGLIELGGEDEARGLDRFVTLLEFMELSTNPNDTGRAPRFRVTLSRYAGQYLRNAAEARAWLESRGGATDAGR